MRYGDPERHVLDFWKAESDFPTPVAFVIHGGGWMGGSKERLHRFVDPVALLEAGISVVAIHYRYVSQAVEEGIEPPVKAPLHDAARVLQFLRSRSSAWNLDKDLRLKKLEVAEILPSDSTRLPKRATRIDRPRTTRSQGTGPVLPAPSQSRPD